MTKTLTVQTTPPRASAHANDVDRGAGSRVARSVRTLLLIAMLAGCAGLHRPETAIRRDTASALRCPQSEVAITQLEGSIATAACRDQTATLFFIDHQWIVVATHRELRCGGTAEENELVDEPPSAPPVP